MRSVRRFSLRELAISLVLFLFCFAAWRPLYTDTLFISGGADYLRSAKTGFWAEYLDLRSVALTEVVHRYARDPEFRQHPWRSMDELQSDSVNRHFHVPEGFYVHAVLGSAGASTHTHRMAAGIIGALLVAALFLLLRQAGLGLLAALAAAGGLVSLGTVALTYTDIDGHDLYLAWALVYLITFGIALERQSIRWWTASLIVLAGAAAALELAPLLLVASVALVLISKDARARCWALLRSRPWWWSPAWLSAALFAFWPGGVLNGGYVISYVSYIYIPLFRTMFFSAATPMQLLLRMTDGSIFLIFCYAAMLAIAAVAAVRRPWKDSLLEIFFIYTLLMAWQGHRNKLTNPQYVAEFLAPLWVTTVIAAERWWGRSRAVGVLSAALLLAVFVTGLIRLPQANWNREATGRRLAEGMAALRSQFARGSCFLTPVNAEPFALYLTGYRIEVPVSAAPLQARRSSPPGCYVLVDRHDAGEDAFAQMSGQCPLRPLVPQVQDGLWVSHMPFR